MRAIRVDEPGGPEQLRVVAAPIPEIGDLDVLIEVKCAGLMYADVAQRQGTYFAAPRFPWFPGREVSGVVRRVGRAVEHVARGDRVVALVLTGGGYAEYVRASLGEQTFATGVTAPGAEILQLPDGVSYSQALVYVTNFRFAHVLLHAHAAVPGGASVLIHGASGGFGSCLTQLARANDNRVIALCRSDAEADFCRVLGADHAFDVTGGDYVRHVLELTGGRGVDFSLNGVGGDTLARDPLAVRPLGEIHAYGYVAGKSTFDPFAVPKSLTLKTFAADDFLQTERFRDATAAMYECFARGPLMDATQVFELPQTPEAHRWIEQGRAMGKIALTM